MPYMDSTAKKLEAFLVTLPEENILALSEKAGVDNAKYLLEEDPYELVMSLIQYFVND